MNKEIVIKKVEDELKLIKDAPVLFISGVIVLTIVFELTISLVIPDKVAAMNEQLQAKNAIIIEKDKRIGQLLDEVIKLQK